MAAAGAAAPCSAARNVQRMEAGIQREPRRGDNTCVARLVVRDPRVVDEQLREAPEGRGDGGRVGKRGGAARMERARAEISHWDGYDYVVVNDNVESCYSQVCEILHAERMRRARQTGLIGFVRELMKD